MNQNRMLVLHLFLYSCLLAAAFTWTEQRIEVEKRRFAAPITELQRRVEALEQRNWSGYSLPAPMFPSIPEGNYYISTSALYISTSSNLLFTHP
jgi:hypothetical protein